MKKKWYQSTGGIIALLILFFPVGLYLMWKYATWNKTIKWIVTAVFVFAVLGNMGGSKTATTITTDSHESTPTVTQVTETPTQPETTTEQQPTQINLENQKELKILQEQKDISEKLTKKAVGLIVEDKMSEAIALYNARWNELAELRAEIIYDKDLTDVQRKNIDKALKADQESITNILSKYKQLYR